MNLQSMAPLTPDGLRARNLGYSTSATVNLPVWDWLSSEHKVKQSEIRRDAAQVALTQYAAANDCTAGRGVLGS